MRQIRRSISIVSVAGILMLSFSLFMTTITTAQAEPLSDRQRSKIQAECAQIKGSLSQLHASDALLRVNRGQTYESLSSRLMNPFNARLNASGLDSKAMTTHTTQYTAALTSFRAQYISYEKKLSEALRIDCRKDAGSFYTAVLEARELRQDVHKDVEKLHSIIDDYGTSVSDFLLNFKRLAE